MRTQTRTKSIPSGRRDGTDIDVLLRRWRDHDDRVARAELVEQFLPLARRLAARYSSSPEPLDDLVQVASIGLLGAIDRFDPDRGSAFVAFAIPTILGELKRHFRDNGWSLHVPRGPKELALRIEKAVREVSAQQGRPPRVQELAQRLEVSVEEIISGLDAGSAHYAMSLDAPVSNSDEPQPEPLMAGIGHRDDGYALVETTASLSVAINRLPPRERRALSMRLEYNMTQTRIAEELGCSQMQVSRLLRRAATRAHQMMDPEFARA